MEQLIQDLEELLAERRLVINLITSNQNFSVSSGEESLDLQSDNPILVNALSALKAHFATGVMKYQDYLTNEIKAKIKEIIA